jgi:hypothetical protein
LIMAFISLASRSLCNKLCSSLLIAGCFNILAVNVFQAILNSFVIQAQLRSSFTVATMKLVLIQAKHLLVLMGSVFLL